VGRIPKLAELSAPAGGSLAKAKVRVSRCVFRIDGALRPLETTIYQRDLLPVGAAFSGPAIVLQTDSTTVVPPGAEAIVDPTGSIILTLGGKA
jgi:N-methylhydantoinase A